MGTQMDLSEVLRSAQDSHDSAVNILTSLFDQMSEEDKASLQHDVRRILLPFDLEIGLSLLESAILRPKDRRSHVRFIVKYGTFAYDILHFAESYTVKMGIDMPCDEKALRTITEKDAEALIATLKEPIDRLYEPVIALLIKNGISENENALRELKESVLDIGEAFAAAGKGTPEEETKNLRHSLRENVTRPLRKKSN